MKLPRTAPAPLVLVLVFYAFLAPPAQSQSLITAGTMNTKEFAPFGLDSAGQGVYFDRFQQVYASAIFPGTVVITQVAFRAYFPYARRVSYTLAVGMGVTARTPEAPGNTFVDGLSNVFTGSISGQLTPVWDDFDLRIGFQRPFSFDPSLGNLILEIRASSASGETNIVGSLFDAEWRSATMAYITTNGLAVVGHTNAGLVTRFYTLTEPGPRLDMAQEKAGLVLSWPITPFVRLQSATNLQPGAIWTDITNGLSVTGTIQQARMPVTAGGRFFRLTEAE